MEAMDLMDPRRRRDHQIRLIIGYVLVGVALLLVTVILLFVAYGFGLQNGRVIQKGLFFLSSTPNPAQVYIDGERYSSDTNTKVLLPEGTYRVALKRDGYRDWQRSITVTGGQVASYTYPFLFPLDLTTTTLHTYAGAPELVSESGDQHWLLVAPAKSFATFDLYDVTNLSNGATILTLPSRLVTTSAAHQSLSVVGWADDNVHVLLKHAYGNHAEYILLNRSNANQSINVTATLKLPTNHVAVALDDHQSDHFTILNNITHVLSLGNLDSPNLTTLLKDVIDFAADGDDSVVYTTPDTANARKVVTMYFNGSASYAIRRDTANVAHVLAVSAYDGNTLIAIGLTENGAGYVYKNPVSEIQDQRLGVAIPEQAFTLKRPTFVDFSPTGQYARFEGGKQLAVYDADNQVAFTYSMPGVLDASQSSARWMDGARLYYMSQNQVVIFDYDGSNRQTLVSADGRYPLAFDSSYKFLYAFVQSADNTSQELFTRTSLRAAADQ